MTRLFAALALWAASLLPAQAGDPLDDVLSHRILPGWTQPDGARVAGLELRLAPGWKTYWRAPGDAGIPPEFSWGGSRNLAAVSVNFPTPQVFWQSGMRSVGYSETVVFPLVVTPRAEGDIRLRGRVELGICSDICIPHTIRFDATLPAGSENRTPAIVAALAQLPYSAGEAGVGKVTCTLSPTADGLRLVARIPMPPHAAEEHAVIEARDGTLWVSEPQLARSGDVLTARADIMHHSGKPFALDRSQLRFTIIAGRQSVDIRGCSSG